MKNAKVIVAAVVALLVVGAAWYVLGDSSLRVVTKDVNYEATFTITYSDGTSTEVKRYKTASITYENQIVDFITFDLDAKFKASQGEDVRLLSPRAGGEYETQVTFYISDALYGEDQVLEYPLSASTNTDFSVLDTGDWYLVFKDVKVTTEEMSDARDGSFLWDFNFKAVVDVWYNLDPEDSEIIHHELTFVVPFHFRSFQPVDPGDGDGGGGGGGNGGSPEHPGPGQGGSNPGTPITSPITPGPLPVPEIVISDPISTQYTPWRNVSDTSANNNLARR